MVQASKLFQAVSGMLAITTALSLCFSSPVSAHARWSLDGTTPPRDNNAGIKTGPCGGVARTNNPAVFAPGETITVNWVETIDHQGHFIISFSAANDEGFEQNVLKGGAEQLPDDQNGTPLPHQFSTTITLPNVECEACTLQLIQYMERSMTNYYSCADIKLVAGGDPGDDPVDENPGNGGGAERTLVDMAVILIRDFEELDVNFDNVLSFDEVETSAGVTQEQFTALDQIDIDGFVTLAELQAVAGEEASEEEESGSLGSLALLLLAFRRRQVGKPARESSYRNR